ncbi:hypothetical protein ACNJX9_32150 [Bradyrhizobium sp. DASA03076]|uniref:hypothetical protein n=1 Tax=Bradyrhizobium sp. BLXBL-03 TaxID=3395916 RepID=UPI003F6FD5BA
MTAPVQVGETARNRSNLGRCFKADTTINLNDDGIVAHLASLGNLTPLAHRTDATYSCSADLKVRMKDDEIRAGHVSTIKDVL